MNSASLTFIEDQFPVSLISRESYKERKAGSGQTLTGDFFKGLNRWMKLAGQEGCAPSLAYGGHETQQRSDVRIYGWKHLNKLLNEQV